MVIIPSVPTLRMTLFSRIRNEQVAGGVHSHACGMDQFRIGRRAAVAGVTDPSPLPATVVMIPLVPTLRMTLLAVIRNEQVAGGVHRHARGIVQFRLGRRAAVAGVSFCRRCPPPW